MSALTMSYPGTLGQDIHMSGLETGYPSARHAAPAAYSSPAVHPIATHPLPVVLEAPASPTTYVPLSAAHEDSDGYANTGGEDETSDMESVDDDASVSTDKESYLTSQDSHMNSTQNPQSLDSGASRYEWSAPAGVSGDRTAVQRHKNSPKRWGGKRDSSERPAKTRSSTGSSSGARKGKWTPEEEAYTARMIEDFNKGLLPLPAGTTLRTYLSEKLNCDPMRITKKYAGAHCIGKRVFQPLAPTPDNLLVMQESAAVLVELEKGFQSRLEALKPGRRKKSIGSAPKPSGAPMKTRSRPISPSSLGMRTITVRASGRPPMGGSSPLLGATDRGHESQDSSGDSQASYGYRHSYQDDQRMSLDLGYGSEHVEHIEHSPHVGPRPLGPLGPPTVAYKQAPMREDPRSRGPPAGVLQDHGRCRSQSPPHMERLQGKRGPGGPGEHQDKYSISDVAAGGLLLHFVKSVHLREGGDAADSGAQAGRMHPLLANKKCGRGSISSPALSTMGHTRDHPRDSVDSTSFRMLKRQKSTGNLQDYSNEAAAAYYS